MAAEGEQVRERLGFLRLEASGSWGVGELGYYLLRLDDAYKAASSITLLIAEPEFPYQYAWPPPFAPYPETFHVLPGTAELQALANIRAGVLRVWSIRLESPGWFEVIGSWNPLKIIADAVAAWRSENTERTRQLRAFQLELLNRMEPRVRAHYAGALLQQTVDLTQPIAIDGRISKVSATEQTA